MACHLAHRIPWDALTEIYLLSKSKRQRSARDHDKRARQLQHAARCFARALFEFQRTDKTNDDERAYYDPAAWDKCEFADGGALMEFQDSLVWGYLELNLILADPKQVPPRMMPDGHPPRALQVLAGVASGAHPDEIAQHLREAFADGRLRPLTAEVAQILRDHAALMFRCMYVAVRGQALEDYERFAVAQFFRFFG